MSHWPKLPVQVVMDWLNARSSDLVVADFGCGKFFFLNA
jgi:ribosomal RNA-processing protein 8